MKNLLFLFLIFYSLILNAETAIIDGKNFECEFKLDSRDTYVCKAEGHELLVVNNGYGYSAYGTDDEGRLSTKYVTKLVAHGKTLYAIPVFSNSQNESTTAIKYPDTLLNRKQSAEILVDSLKDLNGPEALSLIAIAKKTIAANKFNSPIDFVVNENTKFNCIEGKTRELNTDEKRQDEFYKRTTKCDFYYCKDQNGKEGLAYFSESDSFLNPSIFTFDPVGREREISSNLKILSNDSRAKLPIFESTKYASFDPAMAIHSLPNTDQLDTRDFLPSTFKERPEMYQISKNTGAIDNLKYLAGLCSDDQIQKLVAKKSEVIQELNDSFINENLTHIISLVNGNLAGNLMPTSNIAKYGCLYNGTVLTLNAYARLSDLQKLNSTTLNRPPLSLSEAQDLFKRAASMKDIPFGYKVDGCYARAHIMARRFESLGIPTEKVWIKGDLSVPGTGIRWNFHVAPVVSVQVSPDGPVEKYVIDPSLEKSAVPLDTWVATMKANVRGPIVKTIYPFPENAAVMERTAVAISSSEPYLPNEPINLSEAEKLSMAQKTMEDYSKLVVKH